MSSEPVDPGSVPDPNSDPVPDGTEPEPVPDSSEDYGKKDETYRPNST